MDIPKDTILVISGVSCVGKTTVAYEIIKNYTAFRRVSEFDIIRTIIRTSYEQLSNNDYLDINKNSSLFESITDNDFITTKLQSEQLLPYVKEIILRQQRRNIPTIIEGAGIVPRTYFPNNQPLEWLTRHVIFVNLYLANEKEHILRRSSRSKERNYHENISKTMELVLQARLEKNELLHTETQILQKIWGNVFSIDVSNYSPSIIADKIMKYIFCYFEN